MYSNAEMETVRRELEVVTAERDALRNLAHDNATARDACAADLVRNAVDFGGLMAAVKIAADEHQVAVRLADEMVANASRRLLSARFALEEARALI